MNNYKKPTKECPCGCFELLEEMLQALCLEQNLNELRQSVKDYLYKVDKNFKEIFTRIEALEQIKGQKESESLGAWKPPSETICGPFSYDYSEFENTQQS